MLLNYFLNFFKSCSMRIDKWICIDDGKLIYVDACVNKMNSTLYYAVHNYDQIEMV